MNILIPNTLLILGNELLNATYRLTQKPILSRVRAFRGRKITNLKWPDDFYISIGTTNICNARCSFCIYPRLIDNRTLKLGTMSDQLFSALVLDWSRSGGKRMCFCSSVGDPLVDPKIDNRIVEARQAGLEPVIITNAIGIKGRNLKNGLLKAHEIHISTQGTDRTAYKDVYGVDKYDDVLTGIKWLLHENRELGEPVLICINFRNKQTIKEIINSQTFQIHIKPFLSKRVYYRFLPMYDTWAGQISQVNCPGPMNKVRLTKRPCHGTRSLTIKHDGKVYGCGCLFLENNQDDLLLGYFPEQSLEEIATGEKCRNFFESFGKKQLTETCSQCTNYTPIFPMGGIL